jgi:hypothetical protein
MSVAADGIVALGQRISSLALMRGGLAKARRAWAPLGGLWAAGSLVGIVAEFIARGAGATADTATLTAPALVYTAFESVISGFVSAFGVGLSLAGGRRRFDRGMVECLAAFTAIALAFGLWMDVVSYVTVSGPVPFWGLNLGVVMLALAYVSLKLVLWPPGRLYPAAGVTPVRSWRLMRKATRGYLLAHVVMAAPLLAVSIIAFAGYDTEAGELSPIGTVVTVAAYTAYGVASAAVTAALFEMRVLKPASVADVFD